jgi:hypothetical protein
MLIATGEQMYDAKGNCIGNRVVSVEAYTADEAQERSRSLGCSECGGIDEHILYFVKTGQHPAGEVEGYTKKCSKAS